MSDQTTPISDKPEATAPQEPGFVAAEPVTVQEDTPESLTEAAPVVTPSASEPKHPPAKEAHSTLPAHTGMSVDERAYQQYQSLAQTVLDSADIAGKSSEAALAVSGQLRKATGELKELTDGGYKKGRLLLAIGGGVMVVCTLFFLIMGVRLISRINQMDALMEAVGKRVIELNVAMESIEGVNRSMQELTAKQKEEVNAATPRPDGFTPVPMSRPDLVGVGLEAEIVQRPPWYVRAWRRLWMIQ